VKLEEFIGSLKPAQSAPRRWLAERPELLAQVEAGMLRGFPITAIHRWLKQEHGFPYGDGSLRRHCERLREGER
jgi:hypothetical protein